MKCVHYQADVRLTPNLGAVSLGKPPEWACYARARFDICACGWVRRVNTLGEQVEIGPWVDPAFAEVMERGTTRRTRVRIIPRKRGLFERLAYLLTRYVKPLYCRRLRSYYLVERQLRGIR